MIGGTTSPILRLHRWTQSAPTAGTPVRLLNEEGRFKSLVIRALSGNSGTVTMGQNNASQPIALPLRLECPEGQWIAPEIFWILGTQNNDGVECIGTY